MDRLSPAQLNALIIAAIAAVVVLRQFTPRRVTPWAFLWAVALVLRGCVPPGPSSMSVLGVALLVAGLVASAAFGWWRGYTMRLWRDERERWWRKGTGTTALVWLATIAGRLVIGAGGYVLGEAMHWNSLFIGLGVTLGAQQVALMMRTSGSGVGPAGTPEPARLS